MDHDTLNDEAVTIRERDSMRQERVKIGELARIVGGKMDMRGLLRRL